MAAQDFVLGLLAERRKTIMMVVCTQPTMVVSPAELLVFPVFCCPPRIIPA
jgi:hypothetical protein